MIEAIVEAFIRAAATEYAMGVRQFWLFGLKAGDPLMDNFHAASKVRYAFPMTLRRRPRDHVIPCG
jgi:hypothetical protein